MPDQKQAERFVVMHTLVNDWRQGDVIHRDQLKTFKPDDPTKETHDAHDRLLSLGAIRPVEEHEAALAHVPLGTAGLSAQASLRLGQQAAQIDQLTRVVAGLEDRLAFHQQAQGVPTRSAALVQEDSPQLAGILEQNQARIDGLLARVGHLQGALEEAHGKTREQDQSRAQAADQARGGKEQPTGQAPPLDDQGKPASAGGGTPSPPPPPQPGPGVTTGAPAPAFPPPEESRPRRGRRSSGEEE